MDKNSQTTWKTIDDSKIRHIWSNPDGTGEIAISPSFYQENGTPICNGMNSDFLEGEDMVYVRTEVSE